MAPSGPKRPSPSPPHSSLRLGRLGTVLRGWALAMQGQGEEGMAQMRQGLVAFRATGAEYHGHISWLCWPRCTGWGSQRKGSPC